MEKVENVAAFGVKHYKDLYGEPVDEMKSHKLLYFAQRESYALFDSALSDGVLVAGVSTVFSIIMQKNHLGVRARCRTVKSLGRMQGIGDVMMRVLISR